jgi:hypothetical protein
MQRGQDAIKGWVADRAQGKGTMPDFILLRLRASCSISGVSKARAPAGAGGV